MPAHLRGMYSPARSKPWPAISHKSPEQTGGAQRRNPRKPRRHGTSAVGGPFGGYRLVYGVERKPCRSNMAPQMRALATARGRRQSMPDRCGGGLAPASAPASGLGPARQTAAVSRILPWLGLKGPWHRVITKQAVLPSDGCRHISSLQEQRRSGHVPRRGVLAEDSLLARPRGPGR